LNDEKTKKATNSVLILKLLDSNMSFFDLAKRKAEAAANASAGVGSSKSSKQAQADRPVPWVEK